MFRHRVLLLPFAFAAGICLAGLPHWLPPHDRLGLLDPLMIAGLAGSAMLAMMLVVGGIARPLWAWAVMASCAPLSVAGRVAIQAMHGGAAPDPWSFELAVAVLAGALAVLPGVLAGLFVQKIQDPRHGG